MFSINKALVGWELIAKVFSSLYRIVNNVFYKENLNHFDYIHICMFRYKFRKKKKIEKDNAFLKILYENEYEYMISAYSFQTIRKIWWIKNLLTQKKFYHEDRIQKNNSLALNVRYF